MINLKKAFLVHGWRDQHKAGSSKTPWHDNRPNDTDYKHKKCKWILRYYHHDRHRNSMTGIGIPMLTHWGRVTHICVGNQTIIGSINGLSPDRRQAIIWINAEILLIGPLGTNFSEILIEIYALSFKKMHLKLSSGKWRPFCLGLNVLKISWSLYWDWALISSGTFFHSLDPI